MKYPLTTLSAIVLILSIVFLIQSYSFFLEAKRNYECIKKGMNYLGTTVCKY